MLHTILGAQLSLQEGTGMLPDAQIDELEQGVAAERDCAAMRTVLDLIGNRWSLMTLTVLARGTRRFNQLLRDLDGVSRRMLTLTLRNLERDGLISRKELPAASPHVEYTLTPLGHSLHDVMQGVLDWANDTRLQLAAAREAYDLLASRASGSD